MPEMRAADLKSASAKDLPNKDGSNKDGAKEPKYFRGDELPTATVKASLIPIVVPNSR
jgi:hypothetical protein